MVGQDVLDRLSDPILPEPEFIQEFKANMTEIFAHEQTEVTEFLEKVSPATLLRLRNSLYESLCRDILPEYTGKELWARR